MRYVHHLVLLEEIKDQWQSDAAAQKKHSYHQMKRAMYGTRCASGLFQEHMKCVLGEAGYAALEVCHQLYYCLEADSMAAIHGDDILAEGEPEKLNRLDEVLKRLVDVKVLDRTGPGAMEHCQYLKKYIVDTQDKGLHPRAVVSADDMRKDQGLKDCRGMF